MSPGFASTVYFNVLEFPRNTLETRELGSAVLSVDSFTVLPETSVTLTSKYFSSEAVTYTTGDMVTAVAFSSTGVVGSLLLSLLQAVKHDTDMQTAAAMQSERMVFFLIMI